MTRTCPYCGTKVSGHIMAICVGCGNPVSLTWKTKELKEAVIAPKPKEEEPRKSNIYRIRFQ